MTAVERARGVKIRPAVGYVGETATSLFSEGGGT